MAEFSQDKTDASSNIVASGGLLVSIGAFATASCCALPLVFVLFGLGGAWLSIFDTFFEYRMYFLVPALLAVGIGWGLFVRKKLVVQPEACEVDGVCAKPSTDRFTVIVLSVSTVLVLGAYLIAEYQGLVTRFLFSLMD